MIDSFKNFERLRYRLSNDMRELASDSKENSDSLKGQISNTVFATIFSAFITEVALKDNGNGYDFCMIMKMITVFVIIYITSYILYIFFIFHSPFFISLFYGIIFLLRFFPGA